jgi:hypothetical protein
VDHLAQVLDAYDHARFPRGRFLEISDVFEAFFKGIPQFSQHWISAQRCCDGKIHIMKNKNPTIRTVWPVVRGASDSTLREAVQRMLDDDSIVSAAMLCSSPSGPQGFTNHQPASIKLLLDRPSGWWILRLPHPISREENNGSDKESRPWQIQDPLEVTVYHRIEPLHVTYTPVGCVFIQNNNHFIARVLMDDTPDDRHLLHFDGLGGEVNRPYRVGSTDFFHGVPTLAKAIMVMCRLQRVSRAVSS